MKMTTKRNVDVDVEDDAVVAVRNDTMLPAELSQAMPWYGVWRYKLHTTPQHLTAVYLYLVEYEAAVGLETAEKNNKTKEKRFSSSVECELTSFDLV